MLGAYKRSAVGYDPVPNARDCVWLNKSRSTRSQSILTPDM